MTFGRSNRSGSSGMLKSHWPSAWALGQYFLQCFHERSISNMRELSDTNCIQKKRSGLWWKVRRSVKCHLPRTTQSWQLWTHSSCAYWHGLRKADPLTSQLWAGKGNHAAQPLMAQLMVTKNLAGEGMVCSCVPISESTRFSLTVPSAWPYRGP